MAKTHPAWYQTIEEQYKSGVTNVFLVTGTIFDYVVPGLTFKQYLIREQKEKAAIIASHTLGGGTCFLHLKDESSEKKAGNPMMDWKEMLQHLRRNDSDGRIIYVVEYPEFLIGQSATGHVDDATRSRLIDLHQLMNDPTFMHSDNMLILVSESKSGIHEMFLNANSRTQVVNIDYPDMQERLEMIQYLNDSSEKSYISELSPQQLANLTAGLSRMQLEDLMLIAESTGYLKRETVIKRKEELIRKEFGELIEFFDTEGYDLSSFSGQEHIKQYHREAVIEPFKTGDTSYVPKGLLYMGPPGTGKTYFARCLAGEAGINFVEFKMSKITDKWVGTSERNLEKAFNCFQSMAPVGVFIDEVDQVLSRGAEGETNPVRSNIFGMFLSFLSKPENRGQILWVAATNYPNKIDEALKRAGRFDKKVPFFAPSKEERAEVFRFHFNKSHVPVSMADTDFDLLAEETEGFTPAEIENIVVKTTELVHRRGLSAITAALAEEAMGFIMTAQNNRIEEMTDLALKECNDLEFLSESYRKRARMLLNA